MPTDKEKKLLNKYGVKSFDAPRRTPKHKTKSHLVVTKVGGKPKVIRFGAQGADTAPRGRKSETQADKAKRAAFRKRHAKGIKKGKSSGSYWAAKVKW